MMVSGATIDDGNSKVFDPASYAQSLIRKQNERLLRLREQGVDPSPRDEFVHCGNPTLSFGLRWVEPGTDELEFRMGGVLYDDAGRHSYKSLLGGSWPDRGAEAHGAEILGVLVRNWPQICYHYRDHEGAEKVHHDLALTEAIGDATGIRLEIREDGITIVSPAGRNQLKAESVLVVETLMSLGNIIADRLHQMGGFESLTGQWDARKGLADVYPYKVEKYRDSEDDEIVNDEGEIAFYAHKFGVSNAQFTAAAVAANCMNELSSPEVPYINGTSFLKDVSDIPGNIDYLMRVAVEKEDLTEEIYRAESVRWFLWEARAAVYFTPWPARFCLDKFRA